jgi:hypothetical protein
MGILSPNILSPKVQLQMRVVREQLRAAAIDKDDRAKVAVYGLRCRILYYLSYDPHV